MVTTTTGIGRSTSGPGEQARRLEAVEDRHADVEQAHVGPQLAGEGDGGAAVAGLADDIDAVRLEDEAEPGAHHLLVVGDDDAQGAAAVDPSASTSGSGDGGRSGAVTGRRRAAGT